MERRFACDPRMQTKNLIQPKRISTEKFLPLLRAQSLMVFARICQLCGKHVSRRIYVVTHAPGGSMCQLFRHKQKSIVSPRYEPLLLFPYERGVRQGAHVMSPRRVDGSVYVGITVCSGIVPELRCTPSCPYSAAGSEWWLLP